jgi:hypothetical protein
LNEKAGAGTCGRAGGSFTVTEERSSAGFEQPHTAAAAIRTSRTGKRPNTMKGLAANA